MTNKHLLYFLLLFNANLFSQKQNLGGEITYEITMKVDEDKLKKAVSKFKGSKYAKELMISTIKEQDKVNYKLLFNQYESIFKEEKKLDIKREKINLVGIMIGKGLFYTNKKSNKTLNQKDFLGELFLINTPKINWKLTQETKTIGKYICYKAITEKEIENRSGKHINKITAWYTPSIPVNFGPKDYFGLPGLILELEEGNLLYKASKIDLSYKKNIEIKEPTKGKKMSLEEYNRIVKETVKNYKR